MLKKKEKNYQAGGRGRASASICLNKPPSDSLKKDFMVMASLFADSVQLFQGN